MSNSTHGNELGKLLRQLVTFRNDMWTVPINATVSDRALSRLESPQLPVGFLIPRKTDATVIACIGCQ